MFHHVGNGAQSRFLRCVDLCVSCQFACVVCSCLCCVWLFVLCAVICVACGCMCCVWVLLLCVALCVVSGCFCCFVRVRVSCTALRKITEHRQP